MKYCHNILAILLNRECNTEVIKAQIKLGLDYGTENHTFTYESEKMKFYFETCNKLSKDV